MALPPALSLPTQVAAQAEFIVSNLRQTDYQHTEHIDVDRGIYDCDCDGFVGFVLTRVAPDQYAMIPQEAGQSRPRAFEYCLFFSSLTPQSAGWHRIDFLRDVRRGDFIAWRFPEVEIEEGHDTGHVLVAAETPGMDDSGIFTVRVYDSVTQPHFDDTRGDGPGQFPNGVGYGALKFQVDAGGGP